MKEVKELGKRGKVKVIKLNSEGHTECEVSWHTAYSMVSESLDQGMFAFCEPDNVVISHSNQLRNLNMKKVTLFAAVAGG